MRTLVVAAAIVDGGRVLAARRSRPPALAGGWEFPGGKVEAGEDAPHALVREIAEELGAGIAPGPELGRAGDERIELVLLAARLDGGRPTAQDDHDALRWLGPDDLDDVDWLPIDRDLLPGVADHLRAAPNP